MNDFIQHARNKRPRGIRIRSGLELPIERKGINTLSGGVGSASIIHVKLVVSSVCEQIGTRFPIQMFRCITENVRAQFDIITRIEGIQSRGVVSKRRFVRYSRSSSER